MAMQQPSESQRYGDLENTTTFGVAAKRARDNDEKLHTNQVCVAATRMPCLAIITFSHTLSRHTHNSC